MVGGVWEEAQTEAERTAEIWGTVETVSDGRELVYVESVRARGLCSNQQTAGTQIAQEKIGKAANFSR